MPASGAIAITARAGLMLAVALSASLAASPFDGDGDGTMALWFRGLRQPETGASCCDVSDCRRTHARRANGGWEAETPIGSWVPVPSDLVLADKAHPGGAAVLCWKLSLGVICFVPPMYGG